VKRSGGKSRFLLTRTVRSKDETKLVRPSLGRRHTTVDVLFLKSH